MRTPPSAVAGWIGPVLLNLTIKEAMLLERTSAAWREWLESAEDVWKSLAGSCGVTLGIRGPLARFLKVDSWRRVCCELSGVVSRDLDEDRGCCGRRRGNSGGPVSFSPGTVVELADEEFAEIVRPLRSGRRNGGCVEEYTIRTGVGRTRTVKACAVLAAPEKRSQRWWRAVAAVDIEDAAAQDFCCGIAFRYWRSESGGVYTFGASRLSPVHYRRIDSAWTWSPDRINWMPCSEVNNVRLQLMLGEPYRQIATFLHRHDPNPSAFCQQDTAVFVSCSRKRKDDDRATRSVRRALTPDGEGGVLALAHTRVHVVHAPFEQPTHLLHLEPWTIPGHAGGWMHSTNGGSTWAQGSNSLLDDQQLQQRGQGGAGGGGGAGEQPPAAPVINFGAAAAAAAAAVPNGENDLAMQHVLLLMANNNV